MLTLVACLTHKDASRVLVDVKKNTLAAAAIKLPRWVRRALLRRNNRLSQSGYPGPCSFSGQEQSKSCAFRVTDGSCALAHPPVYVVGELMGLAPCSCFPLSRARPDQSNPK